MSMTSSLDSRQGSGEASTLSAHNERSLNRAELDRLRKRTREVSKQFRLANAGVQEQRDVILASRSTSADLISHLPAEVLLRIIELVLQNPLVGCDPHRHVKRELASLSRHWRNLILGTPSLWNCIRISRPWDVPFVEAHVARSAECPLDIEVYWEFFHGYDRCPIRNRINVVRRCRHRWRSLVLRDIDKNLIASSIFARESIALKRLTVIDDYLIPLFRFGPSVDWTSVDYLELQTCINLSCLSNFSSLKTLIIRIPYSWPSRIRIALSLQKLKTLSLSGFTGGLKFRPDTLHFPLLDSLSVKVNHARELMEAIVAPNLRHVCYAPYSCDSDTSSVFGNLSSKFLSVERLSLCDYAELRQTARNTNAESARAVSQASDVESARTISAAFPSVRHVEIHARHVKAFFDTKAACPADGWKHLQVLKVESLFEDEIFALKEWLRRRSLEGKPMLDVIIMDTLLIFSDSRRSALYESFRPYCNVVVPVDFDRTSGLSLSDTPCELPRYLYSSGQTSSTPRADDNSERRCEFCI
ncbi:hypothetical protein EDD17DRAFT_1644645 [Pisolithus thermaeus]|nr:hypothetical protein EDD17DRAFT_1644645 [Pisolithus thermaeus]